MLFDFHPDIKTPSTLNYKGVPMKIAEAPSALKNSRPELLNTTRALIKGQFMMSNDLNHTPEEFMIALERRMTLEGASIIFQGIENLISKIKEA